MKVDVVVDPEFWDDASMEGVVVTWLYSTGAMVKKGEVLLEVAVEKAQFEVIAPEAGKLTIVAPAETVIRRDSVVGAIDTD